MKRAILAEALKLKRTCIPALFPAALCVDVLWLLWCLNGVDLTLTNSISYMAVVNLLMMNTITAPVLIAVLASRSADLELSTGTYRWLGPIESGRALWNGKVLSGIFFLLPYAAAQCFFLAALGTFFHEALYSQYILCFFTLLVYFTALYLIQLSLSLWSQSQLAPLFVGIAGTFTGLFSWFLNQTPLRYLIPWGYPAALCNIGMYYDRESKFSEYWTEPYPFIWLAVLLIFSLAVYLLAGRRLAARLRSQ